MGSLSYVKIILERLFPNGFAIGKVQVGIGKNRWKSTPQEYSRIMGNHSFLRTAFAFGVCRITRAFLRFLHRGGTSLPGKMALLIDRDILEVVSQGAKVLLVTGTNGKTTTTHMISHALSAVGIAHLTNQTGANLLSGITTEFCCAVSLRGKPEFDYAVIECDEGALERVAALVHPCVIVVTNLFRDQLDRYGEVARVLEAVKKGIKRAPQATLCLNADDPLTASLALMADRSVLYYGLDCPAEGYQKSELSDAVYCIRCREPYQYRYHTYAHLGGFFCPGCGYSRCKTNVGVERIMAADSEGSHFSVRLEEKELDVRIQLPTIYNIYNACAAICGYMAFEEHMKKEKAPLPSPMRFCDALSSVGPSFGRMESFDINGVFLQIILVKNPVGCDQVISYLNRMEKDYALVVCLNDRPADGLDISWIWDANYEWLAGDRHLKYVYVLGDRAEELQLRLKYAGIAEAGILLPDDYTDLLQRLKETRLPVFAMPNYTAMLSLRDTVRRASGKNSFWEGILHAT